LQSRERAEAAETQRVPGQSGAEGQRHQAEAAGERGQPAGGKETKVITHIYCRWCCGGRDLRLRIHEARISAPISH